MPDDIAVPPPANARQRPSRSSPWGAAEVSAALSDQAPHRPNPSPSHSMPTSSLRFITSPATAFDYGRGDCGRFPRAAHSLPTTTTRACAPAMPCTWRSRRAMARSSTRSTGGSPPRRAARHRRDAPLSLLPGRLRHRRDRPLAVAPGGQVVDQQLPHGGARVLRTPSRHAAAARHCPASISACGTLRLLGEDVEAGREDGARCAAPRSAPARRRRCRAPR